MGHQDDQRTIAFSAAAIYAGAAFVGLVEALIPGGDSGNTLLGLIALAATLALLVIGPRLPRPALALLGPAGVVLIGVALSETTAYGDGAVLYMWPVLYTALFFGLRGTIAIVAWIAVVHAVVLLTLPAGHGNVDRWIDVVTVASVVAVVMRVLVLRNERLVERLATEARVDPLTGLLNRRGFDERIRAEVARAVREHTSLALVAFDLDHFKDVNDEHGHEVGDRVLAWTGTLLTEQIRGIDIAARIGGEEFVVALPRTDLAAACRLAERVRQAFGDDGAGRGRARFGIADELTLSISGGVAATVAPVDVHALLEEADQALYAAKRTGRDRIVTTDDTACVHVRAGTLEG